MPAICEFYGITIFMYYNDHAPPHFHARYGGQRVLIGINPIRVLAGALPPRAGRMVVEWAAARQEQLHANWEFARRAEALVHVEPLE